MIRSVAVALCALLFANAASAQQLIVNEFYRGGTLGAAGDEWIEVVLLEDLTATELQAYLVGDSQAATNSKLGAYQFTNMAAIASDFPAGTIIVLTGGAGVAVDSSYDPAGNDWNLVLASNGANITAVNNGGDLAGTDVVWVDTAATGTAITAAGFCVNYDSTPGTLGATCQVTIPVPNNNSGSVLGDAVASAGLTGSWTSSVALASMTPGQPNGGANTTSIDDLRGGKGKLPVLSFANASVLEGDSGDFPTLSFSATLDRPAEGDCVFNVESFDAGAPNEATPGVDYTAITLLNVTIPDGQISTSFDVTIIGDDLIEGDEVFTVSAFGEPFECDIFGAEAIGTIIDDDFELPAFEIDDVSVVEGTGAGLTEAVFTVSLTGLADRPEGGSISVDYCTVDGSALAPTDYASTSGTLVFVDGGPLTQTITVPIVRDNIFESDEGYSVVLSNPQGATLEVDTGFGTIVNDDGFPGPAIDDVSQIEGTGGTTTFVFTVSLSNPSATPVEFSVNTVDGSATAPADYTAIDPTVISFPPLLTSQQVSVSVVPDALVEEDETFQVEVHPVPDRPAAGGQPLAVATGTILDDDEPSLSVDDVSVVEGTGAGTTVAVFNVTLSASPRQGEPVSLAYSTSDGSAVAPADYASTAGNLSFSAGGPLSQTVSVPIVRDALDENDETFQLVLSDAVAATIADGTGVATILDDDAAPQPGVADVALLEGDAGNTAFQFTLSLTGPSSFPLSFEVWTVDGSATAPSDYVAIPIGAPLLVEFDPGQTSQNVVVQVHGDELVENDESFSLQIGAAQPAGNGGGVVASATGTILNDDVASLSINDVTQLEGSNGGLTPFVFTVNSSKAFAEAIQIGYQTAPGSAGDPEDFLGGPGTVTLPALALTTTITIQVIADDLVESNETFNVILAGVARASLGDPTGLGTIIDDDDAVAVPALDRWSLLLLLLGVAGLAALTLLRRH